VNHEPTGTRAGWPGGENAAPIISTKDWMLTLFLCAIPVVNLILLFVWGFGDKTNPNKRNYARAALLLTVIFLGLYLIFAIVFLSVFSSVLNM